MHQRPRTALITGGSGGIGLATGRLLVERGYEVVLTARRAGPLGDAAAAIGARWVAGDSADEESFRAVVEAAGPVGLLVHGVGVMAGTLRNNIDNGCVSVLRAEWVWRLLVDCFPKNAACYRMGLLPQRRASPMA